MHYLILALLFSSFSYLKTSGNCLSSLSLNPTSFYSPFFFSCHQNLKNSLTNFEISFDEFRDSLLVNHFPAPSFDQYTNFTSLVNTAISSKREAAMFLAQIIHESIGLRFKKEIACVETGCPGSYHITPGIGIPGRFYYGRGYIQLTWDFNYEAASFDLFNDNRLLVNPDLVAENEEISWSTAFWFWERHVATDPNVKLGKFGASTNHINGFLECRGENLDRARKRFEFYKKILKIFGLDETPDESGCYN
ncbi:unnamed protein product [Brachionus calyciflorus]|uniref:Glycoside hydrolase family 19 catalytic domain-containing protein n=1 Tax=Brachionus calyciflorus TaxID=104777 RepID=A0A813ZNW8_9BILA|nr:unnamed protein product [Brachionus calyciflorus]